MLVLIKGAGDLATGLAVRLFNCHIPVVMTELPKPSAIRRTVCFSEAIYNGIAVVENITAVSASSPQDALAKLQTGVIPVLADREAACLRALRPTAVIDAMIAKKNLGTAITDAPVVIALGPGFCAGKDCHAVVETMRGHNLGRVIYTGTALPNTGIPGEIGGESRRRILRSPATGKFISHRAIGDEVMAGEVIATVNNLPMTAEISGVLRGLLPNGFSAVEGMKSGDIDPRCTREHCFSISDKARAVAGGALEALLHLSGGAI